MIEHVSYSSLSQGIKCGEQFRRRRILNQIIPPGIALIRGGSVHKANEVNMKQKLDSKKDLPVDDLKDCARDAFVDRAKNGIYLTKEDRPEKRKLLNEGLNQTLKAVECYSDQFAPEVQPTAVEQRFSLDIGLELPIYGYIDIEQENAIRDLKITGKSYNQDAVDNNLQPRFYSLAFEKQTGERPDFWMHYLVVLKTKTKHQAIYTRCSNHQYDALYHTIEQFIKMLKAGIFLPTNPENWWCDPKWCGYYYTCKYVGNGKQINWF